AGPVPEGPGLPPAEVQRAAAQRRAAPRSGGRGRATARPLGPDSRADGDVRRRGTARRRREGTGGAAPGPRQQPPRGGTARGRAGGRAGRPAPGLPARPRGGREVAPLPHVLPRPAPAGEIDAGPADVRVVPDASPPLPRGARPPGAGPAATRRGR